MDAGSGQLEKCRSPLASGGAAAVREQSPRFTGFGRSRGDAGIGRLAWLRRPWLQQASAGHPWPACARSPHHRVFRHVDVRGFVDAAQRALSGMAGVGDRLAAPRRSGEHHAAKDVAARGFRPSGTWMYRARVLEQDAEPRGGRNPLAAAAPTRSRDPGLSHQANSSRLIVGSTRLHATYPLGAKGLWRHRMVAPQRASTPGFIRPFGSSWALIASSSASAAGSRPAR